MNSATDHRACLGALVMGLSMGAAIALAGCSTAAERTPRQGPFPTEPVVVDDPRFGVFVRDRVDAVMGERLVVPIELAGGFRPEDIGEVVLDDGRRLPTQVVWIESVVGAHQPGDWLPPAGAWSVTPAIGPTPVHPDPAGRIAPAIVIDPPIDSIGQGIWIAGRRVSVNWLPDPHEVARRIPDEAWSSPVPASIRSARGVQLRVEPARRSPMRRWRARLFSSGLQLPSEVRIIEADGSIRRAVIEGASDLPFDTFADPTLEALARHRESRWLIGLARLYEIDPESNLAVRRRLSGYLDFGDGAIVPAWPIDEDDLDQLLDDLTDQRITPRERVRRARVWLEKQPAGLSWVVSDASLRASDGSPVSAVGIANLRWASTIASLESFAGSGDSLLDPIPPLTVRVPTVESRPAGATRAAVVATIGGEERAMLVTAADLQAKPPGLRIEGLLPDWTWATLRAGASPTPSAPSAGTTAALLYRDHLDRWTVYIECRSAASEIGADDRVRLVFGAAGSSRDLEVTLAPDGTAEVERPLGLPPLAPDERPEFGVETSRFPGGWYARVVLPPEVIEDGRVLRMGVQRTDAEGRRTAWPRPMLPWQSAPGRAAVDLSLWDE
ncbi:MAG: hypothetical protein ACTS22_03735 [Phycisphaerales bacterium]